MQKLPKTHILQNSEDISRTLKNKSTSAKHLSFYKNTNALEVSRLGLAVPKKNAKRSVDRNRIKRLIREAFRQSPKDSHLASVDLVVKLHAPIGKKTRKRLRESERRLIRQQLRDHFQIKA
ncbi:MAG: ribonuclease P protein component [Betaproteobacteria bacterium]|jgi:ribonuclease P protein component